ncbi:hypothetical protein FQR65_LT03521 [Abscondita terminalis]|nr:hypothetical protein FQR65_LT03521 [Abscondita terminalis]
MTEIVSVTCRICLIEVTNGAVFYSLNKGNDLMLDSKLLSFVPDMDLSITLNPVACNQCTVMIHQAHEFRQLCIRNEIVLKNRTLLRSCTSDNDVEMDGDECLLVNTDIPICVEESTSDMKFYYCNDCHYGTNMKDSLINHIFTHRLKCNVCSYTTPNKNVLNVHALKHKNEDTDMATRVTSFIKSSPEIEFFDHEVVPIWEESSSCDEYDY